MMHGHSLDTCPTPTLVITLNYIIFSKYYLCRRVSVRIVSSIRVRIVLHSFLIGTGELAEIADLELHDLKEPVLINNKTELTIFLTLTATLFILGLLGCSTKVFKEDNLYVVRKIFLCLALLRL